MPSLQVFWGPLATSLSTPERIGIRISGQPIQYFRRLSRIFQNRIDLKHHKFGSISRPEQFAGMRVQQASSADTNASIVRPNCGTDTISKVARWHSLKEIENVKPCNKPYKLPDGGSLCSLVAPSGGKLWRWRYRFDGKEKMMAFRKYPVCHTQKAHEQLPKLLVRMDEYNGDATTRFALELIAYPFAPANWIEASWPGFDSDNARWVIPRERMAMDIALSCPCPAKLWKCCARSNC